MPRLASHIFDLPVQELRCGYRSDIYFWRQKVALELHGLRPRVTMQVFQKENAVLCGIDEAIAVLRVAAGHYHDATRAYDLFDRLMDLKRTERERVQSHRSAHPGVLEEKLDVARKLDKLWEPGFDQLDIRALHDGDEIEPWESIMHITGDASLFSHLETVYLGVLARRTRIATNVRRVVKAAAGKTVLYFPARFDHWAVQGGDGYAAHVGGAGGVSTDAQGEWWGGQSSGTVPHALIAAVGGDTVEAARLFSDTYPNEKLVALVDFDNDCVGTSLKCCAALGDRLWGVRLDTSERLIDKSLEAGPGDGPRNGVVPELAFKVREALDGAGFTAVKIVVSGGFDVEKIEAFERAGAPVDIYGVGSSLIGGSFDFTADVVMLGDRPCAKTGREFRPNPKLESV